MRLIFGLVILALAAVSIESRSAGTRKTVTKNEFFDKNIPDGETSLNTDDFENAKKLPKESEQAPNRAKRSTVDRSAMENPTMFEGDIANKGLNKSTIYRFMGQANPNEPSGAMRNAIKGAYARWPGAVIPYTISTQYSSGARSIIADAMNQFALSSCIKIIPRTTQTDYIHIMPDDGCYSYVGKNGGRQVLSLDDGCIDRGVIMHELMHAVGFFHEQSRPDRDQYVEIVLANIKDGYADQFEKYSLNQVDYLGQPYDYYSIMHYGPRTFSKNGQDTIRPVASARAQGITLGNRNVFSAIDIKELNLIAQCSGSGVVTTPATTTTTTRTTTRAPATGCVDQDTNCQLYASSNFCTVSSPYYTYMTSNCRRSCGFCSGTGTCVDTETSCAIWQQSNFCGNTFYTVELRRQLCARTCGLC
uniref:Metalloendopeptidase n=1 Tax=Plectus sambesii TaxID=2011161 RepID=A0A914X8T1_9BILA